MFTDILDEEGVDADSFGFGTKEEQKKEEEKALQEMTKNAFAFVGAAAASSDDGDKEDDDKNNNEEEDEEEDGEKATIADKELNRTLPGESFDLMSTDEDGEVFITAGDYLARQRALESGDFETLADMDAAFEKLRAMDDMGPDM